MRVSGDGFALDSEPGRSDRLEAIVKRWEALNDDQAAIAAEKRELRKEAKDDGFDVAILGMIIERRKLSTEAVIERDQLIETYERALKCGAAAIGTLSAVRGADGTFKVGMVKGAPADAKLTKKAAAVSDAVMMAELARRARAEDL